MQNFRMNSIVRFLEKEYQLITSNNGHENKIVCSIFRNGEFINSRELKYNNKDTLELQGIIKRFHEQRKSEIEFYFNLSEKLKEEKNFELQNMLGLIFVKNNMHLEAIREFGHIINNNPSDTWAHANLGESLLSLKKYKSALKAFQRAIELNPDYADLYNNLGLVYLQMEAYKKAVEQFDKAIELNPYYAEAFFNRALAYILNQINREDFELTHHYHEEVNKNLEKAGLINPSYKNDHYWKGREYISSNEPLKAFENLNIAKHTGTQFFYRYDKYEQYLKLILMQEENQFEMIWKYIKFLQRLIKKYPNHADLYNDLGLAYCMLRNFINEKAINCFKTAAEINPKYEKAQRNLKLSSYERTGSELFLKAITLMRGNNGKIRIEPSSRIETKSKTAIDQKS